MGADRSAIEHGVTPGSAKLLERLATVLTVALDDLVPQVRILDSAETGLRLRGGWGAGVWFRRDVPGGCWWDQQKYPLVLPAG